MDNFNSDLVLHIIQYLNVVDSGRLATAAQRYYYLVHQYRKIRGPQLVTASSWDKSTFQQRPPKDVVTQPLNQLQMPPNLVLAFNTTRGSIHRELPRHLPPNAIVVGACAHNIQVSLGQDNVECKSNASVMYASFPGADIVPFCLETTSPTGLEHEITSLQSFLTNRAEERCSTESNDTTNNADNNNDNSNYSRQEYHQQRHQHHKEVSHYWKAVIVYACGHGAAFVESFVSTIQQTLPHAAIVGGICSQGYVSDRQRSMEELQAMSVRQLRDLLNQRYGGSNGLSFVEKSELVHHIYQLQQCHLQDTKQHNNNSNSRYIPLHPAEDCVFGVVLGGDAPVRSVVSRGVRSIIQGTPQPSSPYVVRGVTLARPEDPDFIFQGNEMQPIHMIHTVYNKATGITITASELMARIMTASEFIGIKRANEDGFELHMLSPYGQAVQSLLILTDGSDAQMQSLEGAEIDFFCLNGDACCEDMEETMNKLKEQTQGEEILGAVMYSCSGRGPGKGNLIREDMADATRFCGVFPKVPCLGFYAGGEVGPLALAGNEKVFQTGKATVQGFTAVFCLFIVPVPEKLNYNLDDCRANVVQFIKDQLWGASR